MYKWIQKHKIMSVILIFMIPIVVEFSMAAIDWLLRSRGVNLNFLGLDFSDRYAFLGSYLGGFATLMAVIITIDNGLSEQRRQRKEETAPMLVLQSIPDHRNLEKAATGLERLHILLTEETAQFVNSLSTDVPCINSYYLTNFGMGAAINTVITLYNETGRSFRSARAVSLLPNEKVLLQIGAGLATGQEVSYLIEIVCRDVYGDGYKFEFVIWIEKDLEDASYEVSTRLYSERVELPRDQKVRAKIASKKPIASRKQ